MSCLERSAVDCRIKCSIMSKCDCWKVILHISILRIVTFCEALVKCCMKRSTFAFDRGLCPPVVICLIPRYRFMLWTTPPTNSCASSLTNIKVTPLWKIIPESSALATPSIFLSGRNQREASLVHRLSATKMSP